MFKGSTSLLLLIIGLAVANGFDIAMPEKKCSNAVCVGQVDGTVSYVSGTCNQFIICNGGCDVVMNCPNNLQYNLKTKQCDYPENVQCPWQSTPPTTGPSGITCAQPGKCVRQPDGTLFADINSNGYIVCQCECEIVRPCPAGTKFHELEQACVYVEVETSYTAKPTPSTDKPTSSTPKPTPSTAKPTLTTPKTTPSTPKPTPTTPKPTPTTPKPTPTTPKPTPTTPKPTPTAKPTPTPTTPKVPVPTPTTPGTTCFNNLNVCVDKPDGSVFYVDGTCNQYIFCVGGCANILSCPNNLQYNLQTKQCDYPENVQCPWQSTPPTTGPSGITCAQPGKCARQPDGTMFADPNGYIVCQCECEIVRPCPTGTKFDEQLLTCNYV